MPVATIPLVYGGRKDLSRCHPNFNLAFYIYQFITGSKVCIQIDKFYLSEPLNENPIDSPWICPMI